MKPNHSRCALAFFLAILPCSAALFPEEIEQEFISAAALAAPGDVPAPSHYAPDRAVQILHLKIDLTPDFARRTIAGKVVYRLKPISQPVTELQLDAVDLTVSAVTAGAKIKGFQVTDKKIIVTFEKPLDLGAETDLTISYQAEPSLGLYFRTAEMGYPPADTQLWTQGESEEARHWFPSFDSPNQKFPSEMICHVPDGMIALSNGKLVSRQKDANGMVSFHWQQEKPHTTYLVTLVAGFFKKVEDKYRDVPLAFYTAPSDFAQAPNSFRDTRDIMEFFEKESGVPYPWAKYDQVCVLDFHWGGMENTSQTTLTDRTLFTEASQTIRSSQSLVAHEMAHQWFGDLVTCKDWSQTWLNEGFATYYARLYDGHKNGRDSFLYESWKAAKALITRSNDVRPIVSRKFDEPEQQFRQFGFLAYGKGSWVLQMLRADLGEDLYRRCIRTYLERHQFNNVVTEDLRAVIEELSGRSFDQFFDQWLYHAHFPELEVSWSWDEKTKIGKLSIQQTQKLNETVGLFKLPLAVRFQGKSGTRLETIQVQKKEEDFYFPLAEAPDTVRIDPELQLLASVSFPFSRSMLRAQLNDEKDVVGRLIAVEQLATKKDHESVELLKKALNSDKFYGVQVEAAKALQKIHNDEALEVLLASHPSEPRVRYQVAIAIAAFFNPAAFDWARKLAGSEKNPDIAAQAIRALGNDSRPESRRVLVSMLQSKSYRNALADAAVSAFRAKDDPTIVPILMETLRAKENEFSSTGFGSGLGAIGYLSRNELKKDEARMFLLPFLSSKKDTIRVAAINALGALEDPQAIAALETISSARESSEQRAATAAIEKIRATGRPADNLRDLRSEVLDLKKENRDLRKELDALKKKIEAVPDK